MLTNSVGLAEISFNSFIVTKVIHEKHEGGGGWLNPPGMGRVKIAFVKLGNYAMRLTSVVLKDNY